MLLQTTSRSARKAPSELANTRQAVDAFAIPAPKAAEYFSNTITALLSLIDRMSEMSDDGRVVQQSIALAAHVRRKEFAGQERATGAVGFGAGEFAQPVYLNLQRLKTMQDVAGRPVPAQCTTAADRFHRQHLERAGDR